MNRSVCLVWNYTVIDKEAQLQQNTHIQQGVHIYSTTAHVRKVIQVHGKWHQKLLIPGYNYSFSNLVQSNKGVVQFNMQLMILTWTVEIYPSSPFAGEVYFNSIITDNCICCCCWKSWNYAVSGIVKWRFCN